MPGHMARVRRIPNVDVLPFMPTPGAVLLARVDNRMAPLTVRDRHVPLPVNPLTSAVTTITFMTSGSRKVERRLPAAVSTPYPRPIRIGHWVPVTIGAGVATGHLFAAASRARVEGAPCEVGLSPRDHPASTSVAFPRWPWAITIARAPVGRIVRPIPGTLRGTFWFHGPQFQATLLALILGYPRDVAMPHHSSTVTANLCRCLLGRPRAF